MIIVTDTLMNTELIDAEIERLSTELGELEQKRQLLDAKILPKRKELEHWTGIRDLRITSEGSSLPFPEALVPMETESRTNATVNDDQPQEYGAKARAMREFVLSANGSGVTMKEIIEAAAKISPHPAFAYQWVNRQRRAKPPRLEKKGKRFFATERMTME